MRPELNPYRPGSGLRPPALVGRVQQVQYVDQLILRVQNQGVDRALVVSGLRGVGKTVLLQHLKQKVEQQNWMTVWVEGQLAEAGKASVRRRLAREFAVGLRRHSIRSRLKHIAAELEKVVGNFEVSVAGVGVSRSALEPATSGVLEIDLQETVETIAAALQPRGQGLGVFIDEMQDLDEDLLTALIAAQHHCQQNDLPFFVFGAGLPNLPSALTSARSYAERLFHYLDVDALPAPTAAQALAQPAEALGARFEPAALGRLVAASGGYPYFIQEYGRAVWDLARGQQFTDPDAEAAVELGRAHLDGGFYPARWDRATSGERAYLGALADLTGSGRAAVGTSEVAARLGTDIRALSKVRAAVIAKGLVFVPERGLIAFSVPGMDDYIRRQD